MFNASAAGPAGPGPGPGHNGSTAEFLASLPRLYAPLAADLCAWLAEQGAAADALACEPASTNSSRARLPEDVCARLEQLAAPLDPRACLRHAPSLEYEDMIRASLLAVLAVLSFFGNCYTIHSIRNKASPAPVYKLILHLSVADVVVSLVCIAGEAIWMFMVQWTFGNVACKVWKFLEMTALHGSSYVVVLIAQNRWVAVNHPLASRRPKSSVCGLVRDVLRCASPRSVLLVWVVGACLSIPQLMMFSVQVGPFYEEYYQCVTYDVGATLERVYNIINFIALFVIPLLGLIVSYLSIYCTLSRGQREIRSVDKVSIATHDQNRQRSMKRAMVKSRWIAVVIVCAYIVFWLPYYGTMLVYFLSPGQWYDSKWMDWIFFFGMANSVVNPAVYGMFQLWKPKRRKQWSCFRPREGSTQLTHLTIQESLRRTKGHKPGGGPGAGLSPTGSLSLPPSPVAVPLSALPDVRQEAAPRTPRAETSQQRTVAAAKPANLSWRARVLRKYRTLRAASSNQTHI